VDLHFKEAPDALKELKAYRAQTQSVLQVIDPEAVARKTLDVAVHAFNAEGGALFLGNGQDKPLCTVGKWQSASAFRVPFIAEDGQVLACLALGRQHDGGAYTDQDRRMLQENLDLSKRALVLAWQSAGNVAQVRMDKDRVEELESVEDLIADLHSGK
jgi:hypothetical protein